MMGTAQSSRRATSATRSPAARRRLVRRGAAATAVAAFLAVFAAVLPASAESQPLPLTGAAIIRGHGYGHGHGMSQWGAYGAATKGLTHQQILAFYYPGTTLDTTTPGALRILVSGVPTGSVTVAMRTGLTFTTGATSFRLGSTDGGVAVTRWRVVPNSNGGQALQWLAGSTWKTSAAYGNLPNSPGFSNPVDGTVRLLRLDGTFRAYPSSVTSTRSGSSLMAVNATAMESYLRGVVPNEMPASWPAAALRSQAVAARTYAAYEKAHTSSSVYDVCDTTSCQVYDGWAGYNASGTLLATYTHPNADAAVSATSGVMVRYQGAPAFTQFSAANGGWTAAGTVPYLVAKPDPYDGVVPNSAHSWTVTSSTMRTTLQNARPAVGTLQSMLLVRDGNGEWGGRIRGVTLVGSSGTATLGWDTLRSLLGLKSEWFTVSNADFLRKDVSGDGLPEVYSRDTAGVLYALPFTGSGLGTPRRLGGGWNVMSVVAPAGDLNGNAVTELLTRDTSGGTWCYPVPSSGYLVSRTAVNLPTAITTFTGVGDVTGDGLSDWVGIDRSTGTLWLYSGNGSCGFSARRSLGGGWNVMDMVVGAGDINGDGRGDLWARDQTTGVLWSYRLDGAGNFVWPRLRVGAGWNVMKDLVALGDVNGNGSADLLARDTSGAAWIYPGTGAGTFGTRTRAAGDVSAYAFLR